MGRIDQVQILVLAIGSGRQHGDLDVEFVQILVFVVGIHFDDDLDDTDVDDDEVVDGRIRSSGDASGSGRSDIEIERPTIKFEDVLPEVAGVYPRVMTDGEMDAGAWSCGMVAGLIHDIPTVKDLIDRVMAEAETIIRGRLEGFLDGRFEPVASERAPALA